MKDGGLTIVIGNLFECESWFRKFKLWYMTLSQIEGKREEKLLVSEGIGDKNISVKGKRG